MIIHRIILGIVLAVLFLGIYNIQALANEGESTEPAPYDISMCFDEFFEEDGVIYARGDAPQLIVKAPEDSEIFVEISHEDRNRKEVHLVNNAYSTSFNEGWFFVDVYERNKAGEHLSLENFPMSFLYDDTAPTEVRFNAIVLSGLFDENRQDYHILSNQMIEIQLSSEDIYSPETQIFVDTGNGFEEASSVEIHNGFCNEIAAYSADCCGNESDIYICQIKALIDEKPPEINVECERDEELVRVNVEFTDSGSGLYYSGVSLNNEEKRWEDYESADTAVMHKGIEAVINEDELKIGKNYLDIEAMDCAGNTADYRLLLQKEDNNKPEIEIYGAANGGIYDSPVGIGINIEDDNLDADSITIKAYCTSEMHEAEAISFSKEDEIMLTSDGHYEFYVSASDMAGNHAERRLQFVIDKSAPVIKGLEPYRGQRLKEFSLSGEMGEMFKDDTIVQYHLYVNGQDYSENTILDKPGEYVLKVYAYDQAGNLSEDEAEFSIFDDKEAQRYKKIVSAYNGMPVSVSLNGVNADKKKLTNENKVDITFNTLSENSVQAGAEAGSVSLNAVNGEKDGGERGLIIYMAVTAALLAALLILLLRIH